MKKTLLLIAMALLMMNCKKSEEQVTEAEIEVTYTGFGAEITADNAINQAEMTEKFHNMKEGDTIAIKFKSNIIEVCQKKGCWMSMDLDGDKDAFIRFTDYEFFVPMDAQNQPTIVEGRAYLSVITVDELKHFAKDAEKSQEEIDAITEPKITYAIQADGVLIQNRVEETATEQAVE